MEKEIITSNEDLKQLIKDGHFFNFCVAFALNKGFRNAITEKKDVSFTVGDYDVKFDYNAVCFILSHKVYFARIITAYLNEVCFIGDDENEVINELLKEFEKELTQPKE